KLPIPRSKATCRTGNATCKWCCCPTSLCLSIDRPGLRELALGRRGAGETSMSAYEPGCSLSRREALRRTGIGFGALALGQLLSGEGLLESAASGAVAEPIDAIRPLAP